MKLKATLRLENGMEFHGWSFGCADAVSGEVVFNTSMVGYPEQLTDATYSGQILCLTYPLIGNYGIPSEALMAESLSEKLESDRIHPKGLVVFDVCEDYSNWEAEKGLVQWMKEQNLTGIYGIDTRELTKILRENGSMKGYIIPEGAVQPAECAKPSPSDVCCKEPIVYKADKAQDVENINGSKAATAEGKKVIVVDLGVKHSIIRGLIARGVEVVRVPYNYDFTGMEYDGVYVSNGPGCACSCDETIAILKKVLSGSKPVFGYGMGYHLMAKAAGCELVRLAHPHRGANQPVRKEGTNRTYISSQNVCRAVKAATIPADWEVYFTNLNDGAIDGFRHLSKPFIGLNFAPEVCVGLNENVTPLDEFVSKL
ncbi:MAG: glutamine-hydrolyzing carbamoyl-phosphate synthase small subunit [Bacteroidales bacterium]|nr:glutamine-hydrolyzing carbamoyl-phosphate synthase small subunit [Bacteroidales bacterium]